MVQIVHDDPWVDGDHSRMRWMVVVGSHCYNHRNDCSFLLLSWTCGVMGFECDLGSIWEMEHKELPNRCLLEFVSENVLSL